MAAPQWSAPPRAGAPAGVPPQPGAPGDPAGVQQRPRRAHSQSARSQGYGGGAVPSLADAARKAAAPPIGARGHGPEDDGAADGRRDGGMGGLLRRARSSTARLHSGLGFSPSPPGRDTAPSDAALAAVLTRAAEVKSWSRPPGKRPELFAVRRQRLVLLGPGEAGKTSLLKCFAKTPVLFKALPAVGTTTGIDVEHHRVRVGDEHVDVSVMDFAGQEVYHSHSLFLSTRAVYAFVWDMSVADNDGLALTQEDERRFRKWADTVQAKCPGAQVVALGTHMDMLRDTSREGIECLLDRVRGMLGGYFATLQGSTDTLTLRGVHAVSCKDFTTAPTFPRIRDLFAHLCGLCMEQAARPDLAPFPGGLVPRSVVALMCALNELKRGKSQLVLPLQQYNVMARELGVAGDRVHAVTVALHDWGLLYLFDTQSRRLGRNDCVFLHPEWLAKVVAAVFTYVHACQAPAHERACMQGTIGSIDVAACDAADPEHRILDGVLSAGALAPALFGGILGELQLQPTPANSELCITMLRNLDIIYPNTHGEEESPGGSRSASPQKPQKAEAGHPEAAHFYIPSIFTRDPPPALQAHFAALCAARGEWRRFNLRPLPHEVLQMLHCRLWPALVRVALPPPPPPKPETAMVMVQRWDVGAPLGLRFASEAELRITEVVPETAAALAAVGRYLGWRVTHAGGRPVANTAELTEEARRPDARRLQLRLERQEQGGARSTVNNWRWAWWLGAGGGAGEETGCGPTRALAVANPRAHAPESGGTIDLWAVHPPDLGAHCMGADRLADLFAEQLVELLRKFPGVTLTVQRHKCAAAASEAGALKAAEAAVRRGLPPAEAEFLLRCAAGAPAEGGPQAAAAAAGAGGMRMSLLLDAFVRAQMGEAGALEAL